MEISDLCEPILRALKILWLNDNVNVNDWLGDHSGNRCATDMLDAAIPSGQNRVKTASQLFEPCGLGRIIVLYQRNGHDSITPRKTIVHIPQTDQKTNQNTSGNGYTLYLPEWSRSIYFCILNTFSMVSR